jgi:hypothetical protein
MIEILDNVAVLTQPVLDLRELRLAGVALGSPAALIPQSRVVEADLSSIVASLLFDKNQAQVREHFGKDAQAKQYFDAKGEPIPFEQVLESVVRDGGTLHLGEEVSFRIVAGKVVRFSLYGRSLSAFDRVQSLNDLIVSFGQPDRVQGLEAEGELIGYDAYYAQSRKWVRWDNRHARRPRGHAQGWRARQRRAPRDYDRAQQWPQAL